MGISISIFRMCAAISMMTLAAGCASQTNGISAQAAIQGAVNAIGASLGGQPAGAAANSAPIGVPSESSFKNILSAQSGAQWPRVALTITALQSSAFHSLEAWQDHIPPSACMRLSAVVWADMKTSRNIPEETFCVSQMRPTNINSSGEIFAWGSLEDLTRKTSNTGHTRTNGPTPPAKLYPEAGDYKNFFNTKASGTFGVLIRLMGYDLSIDGVHDRRLWVVSIPSKVEIEGGQKVLR